MTKIFDALAKDNGNPTKTNKLSNKEAKQPLNCTPRASGTPRMSTRRWTDRLTDGCCYIHVQNAQSSLAILNQRILGSGSRRLFTTYIGETPDSGFVHDQTTQLLQLLRQWRHTSCHLGWEQSSSPLPTTSLHCTTLGVHWLPTSWRHANHAVYYLCTTLSGRYGHVCSTHCTWQKSDHPPKQPPGTTCRFAM